MSTLGDPLIKTVTIDTTDKINTTDKNTKKLKKNKPKPKNTNEKIYFYFKEISNKDRQKKCIKQQKIGTGVRAIAYKATIPNLNENCVLKTHFKRNRYSQNEFLALQFLRQEMIEERAPHHFVFMYSHYNNIDKFTLLLEDCGINYDKYMVNKNKEDDFINIFKQVAKAVQFLESVKMNHGDLWTENVLIKDDIVKLIDYDSAYKEESLINRPSCGGAHEIKNKFVLGYDLNRFFDCVWHHYLDVIDDMERKLYNINRKLKKQKQPILEELSEQDKQEFIDTCTILPENIANYVEQMEFTDPDDFNDISEMSGEYIFNELTEFQELFK